MKSNCESTQAGTAPDPRSPTRPKMRLDRHVRAAVQPAQSGLLATALSVALSFHPDMAFAALQSGSSQSDRVVRVVDGDTMVLETVGRVRLIGVNTPETVSPAQRQRGAPPDCFGAEASAQTKKV